MRTASIILMSLLLLGCNERQETLTPLPELVEDIPDTTSSGKQQNMPHPELEFFNSLSGSLSIELSVAPETIGNTANLQATPDAKIESLRWEVQIFNRDTREFRTITSEELQSVAFRESEITLKGMEGSTVTHRASNGEYFTVKELIKAVEATEQQTRGNSEWFDGVDVHHIYFEGIHPCDNGVWEIYWGS